MPPDPHARPTFPDPCLSIHVFGSVYKIYASGSSAKSMCPVHILAAWSVDPLQKPCLRILHKIHASGPARGSMCPEPCLRIYASAALSVHVSGTSARSMPPLHESCLRIHASMSQRPYHWILVHICDSARRSMYLNACLSVRICRFATAWTKTDTALQRERFCAQETRKRLHLQTWNRHRATTKRKKRSSKHTWTSASQYEIVKKPKSNHSWTSASQYEMRNGLRPANLDLPKHVFCGPPTAAILNRSSPLPLP